MGAMRSPYVLALGLTLPFVVAFLLLGAWGAIAWGGFVAYYLLGTRWLQRGRRQDGRAESHVTPPQGR